MLQLIGKHQHAGSSGNSYFTDRYFIGLKMVFSTRGETIILCEVRFNPLEVGLK